MAFFTLPNGCRCSDIVVHPKNWKDPASDLSDTWMIHYRFYDPTFERPHHVRIKSGLNRIKNRKERQAVVREMIAEEWHKLRELGYNPITRTLITPLEIDYPIDPSTPFIAALREALPKLAVAENTRDDIGHVINGVEKAARQLRLTLLPISAISRKHIKIILEHLGRTNPRWSNNRFNTYRAYLMMLFCELVELEAVTANPVRDIRKKKVFKKLKAVLTEEQRAEINRHLRTHHYRYWLFINLYFHSGARMPEILQQRPSTVDLKAQKYRCIVRKGTTPKEVERTIKTIALPYWEAFLSACTGEQYLFGVDFLPADKPMCVDTPGRWWKRIVKDPKEKGGLGIAVDFYSLKHLNTDEITATLGARDAARLNAHESEEMVLKVYAVGEAERQHQRLKEVGNEF